MRSLLSVVPIVALVTACAPPGDGAMVVEGTSDSEGLTASEITRILAVANRATLAQLDVGAGLDRRAAEGIVTRRDGGDRTLGTADDDRFDTLAELDAVPWVGAAALQDLLVYADEEEVSEKLCLIISEYIEAAEIYYKAIELFNCGTSPVDLSTIGVCLVRNADTTCTVTGKLSAATLAPGAVWGVCRRKEFSHLGATPYITRECDDELPGVMTHNGDDRLLVFHDVDGDAAFARDEDEPLDAFGVVTQVPSGKWWADRVLRRCDLTPFDGFTGTTFFAADRFTQHTRGAQEHYGTPPAAGGCP
jgi:hypothetical protein